MHPLDTLDRRGLIKEEFGVGFCNITKCCTEVCPEGITITDNAIIPLKERVADEYFDPVRWLLRKVRGEKIEKEPARIPVLARAGETTAKSGKK
jgi:succinate dehydrogenase / fumarate reductase iron-sulfur subunit